MNPTPNTLMSTPMNTTLRISFAALLTSLLVACGGGGSAGCSAVLGILPDTGCSTSNTPPVANAGVTQNVSVGSLVTLDGSGSRDVNNQSLTYLWQMTTTPAGSLAALSSSTNAKPTFTADIAGTYTITLVVNDGKANSTVSTVSVYASVSNSAPVANAGPNQSITVGSVVTLDGTASTDANRDPLTYKWSLSNVPTGSGAALNATYSPNPRFTADMVGTYTAILTVNDGKADSLSSVVVITASAANSAPVANAGAFQNVVAGQLVSLDGTASSDANRDLLTYKWVLISKPVGSNAGLSSTTSSRPTFTADLIGTYVLSLQVNDGKLNSELSYVSITATVANSVPVANAGTAQAVTVGATVTLNGLGSSDANGDVLLYKWVMTYIPPGSNATLSSLIVAQPTFIADVAGVYVASLIVNDGKADSTVSTVAVTATAP